jgi:long-chain acyl-CoA synthetase
MKRIRPWLSWREKSLYLLSVASAGMTEAGFQPGGSLARLFAWRVAERPDFPFCWVEEDGPYPLSALAGAADGLAARLRDAGVGPGDRVLVRLGNDERFLPALIGTWLVGAAAVAVHPAAPAADVERVAAAMETAATVFGAEDPLVGKGTGPAVAMGRLDPEAMARLGPGPAMTRSDPAAASPRALDVPEEVSDDDPAIVLLTSGTTGEPKGVVLSHGNAWANLAATVSAFRRGDTRLRAFPSEPKPPNLVANPLSHTAGVVRLLFALYVGRSIVLLRKFDAAAAKRAVDAHGIDQLTLNPAMLRMLLDTLPPGAGLGRVRYVSSGTAPLPAALREAFEARFGVPVLQAYGQTEAFGAVAIENVADVLAGRRRPGSVGRPLPGVELRIAGPGGEARAAGEEGEIWVRTPSSTRGYLGDSGGAAPVDTDGWLHTGDVGHLDGDGYLYVTGRVRNVIICGGFNVIPEEVEARLLEDPAVRDAAVVGVPDERLGEIPVALAELSGDPDAVLDRLADRLVAFKRPRRLFVVTALPRVPNGKVDRPAAVRLATELSADGCTVATRS